MRAGPILEQLLKNTASISGGVAIAIQLQKPVPREDLTKWREQLLEAVNNIETLLGNGK